MSFILALSCMVSHQPMIDRSIGRFIRGAAPKGRSRGEERGQATPLNAAGRPGRVRLA
jgi:hypothetical protein